MNRKDTGYDAIVNAAHDSWRGCFVVSLALAALGASSAEAQQFSAAVSGYQTIGCYFLAGPAYTPSAEWVAQPYAQTIPSWTDDVLSIDSADGQTVLAVLRTQARVQIVQLEFEARYPNRSRAPFFDGLPGYHALQWFAVGRDGRIFVAIASGAQRLAVISSTGTLEKILDVIVTGNMSVAADGCTLFFADRNVIRRVNGCTGASLEPFVSLSMAGDATDVAVLSNGNVLATQGSAILQFDAAANLLRTFTIRANGGDVRPLSIEGIAVSSNERVAVVAAMRGCQDGGQLIAMSLSDGSELWRRDTSYISTATGVAVGSDVIPIPTLSTLPLLVLALALGTIGLASCRA